MEVEVKLRLPDAAAHRRLSDALASFHRCTHLQENIFFDGPNGELAAGSSALRLRFYGSDSRCVLSLKSRPVLKAGISRVEEVEEDIDPSVGRACVAQPCGLLSLASTCDIMKNVITEFNLDKTLVCLGGFKNVRAVYDWKDNLVLELDETSFSFGTVYEVECESENPEKAKELLEGFFKEVGVEYEYSRDNKFAIFRAGKLLS
ncbi:hypothetical protein LUZ60_004435 [Juncus effusus]|nr:hypothetical protein LUZ60_004435 [Juncus effusus]